MQPLWKEKFLMHQTKMEEKQNNWKKMQDELRPSVSYMLDL